MDKPVCELCGEELPRGRKRFCKREHYHQWWREEVARKASAAGNARLSEMREAGEDPAHGGKTARSRGAKIARSNSLKPRKGPLEEWRPVVGYEGLYSVSDRGRVRSEERETRPGRVLKEKILKPSIGTPDHPNVTLYSGDYDSESVRPPHLVLVSRLVAEAFIGPRPEGAFIVFRDGNSKNTAAANLSYAISSRKLTQAQIREAVRLVVHEGKARSEVARRFGVSPATISRIAQLPERRGGESG